MCIRDSDHGRSGPMCAVLNDGDVRWNAEGNIDSSWGGEWRAVCESPAYLEKMRCNPTTLMPSTRAACEQAAQNMGYDFKDLVNTEPEPPVNCAKCAVLNISPGYTTVQWNPDGKPDSTCGGPWYAVCVAPPPTHVNIEFFSNAECTGEPTLTSQVRSDGTCVEAPSDVHSIYTTDYTHWGVSTLDSYTYRSCSDSSQGECDNQFETTRTTKKKCGGDRRGGGPGRRAVLDAPRRWRRQKFSNKSDKTKTIVPLRSQVIRMAVTFLQASSD